MAGREQPYDPYIPAGSSGQGANGQYEGGNQRTAAIQSVRRKGIYTMLFGVFAPYRRTCPSQRETSKHEIFPPHNKTTGPIVVCDCQLTVLLIPLSSKSMTPST